MRPDQSAEVRIPMDEIAPKIKQRSPKRPELREKSPRKVGRPASDSIEAPSSSTTPPPPLPPRPNSISMTSSGLDPGKPLIVLNSLKSATDKPLITMDSPQIPQNYYPPEQSTTSRHEPASPVPRRKLTGAKDEENQVTLRFEKSSNSNIFKF